MRIKNSEKAYSPEDNKLLYRRSGVGKVLFVLAFIFFALYSLSLFFPFLWAFVSSFKEGMEFADITQSAFALPKKWMFSNWVTCFKVLKVKNTTFIGMVWNSIWYVAVGMVLSLFAEAAVSYALTKYKQFKISTIMYTLVIFFMTFPVMGKTGSNYRTIYSLGLGDSPLYVIVFSLAAFGSNFLIFCASWTGVSDTYAEAAKIDGAGHFVTFFRVMLPMLKGPIVALGILSFIGRWNAYETILLYLPSYPTLATGLYLFQSVTTRMVNTPVYFCGIFISIIPTLTIFAIFSETIMSSVTQGGLKG